ncbi:MAG: hypothetical protein ACOC37_03275 [Spirochaetota bacterium]
MATTSRTRGRRSSVTFCEGSFDFGKLLAGMHEVERGATPLDTPVSGEAASVLGELLRVGGTRVDG